MQYELSYDYSQLDFSEYLGKAERHFRIFNNLKDAEDTKKHLIELNKLNKDVYCNFVIKKIDS